jgi:predicted anti-sigma-YlaC factor YlaD
MRVTRDVVLDLLPLYVAGEASADTRALVDEFLGQDPELRRRADEARLEPLHAGGPPAPTLPPDLELRSLRRTRGRLRWQRLTYAWALTLSFLSLSSVISFEGGHLHVRLLLLELPHVFVPCLVLAAACWANYFLLRRRGVSA